MAVITRVLIAGVLAVPCICAAATVHVDIPAELASAAINTLGHEMGLEIIYVPAQIGTVMTRRLQGDWEPREALRRLLEGTGLTYREVAHGTLVVERISGDESVPVVAHQRDLTANAPATVVVRSAAIYGVIPNLTGIDPLIVGREEIEKSGLMTAAELVNTLPQNFGGGPNENTVRGNEAQTNSSFGSGVNLRGLSDDGTIVLVNGRRLAPSGTAGAFTDIGNLPLAAIDHMEVIPEGATALYGVDAVGGIVNFVTRQDVGLETHVEVGGLAKGAAYDESFGQSSGRRWATGSLFALFEYDERDALPADRRRLATSDLSPFGGQNFDTVYGNPGTVVTFSPTQGYTTWAIPHEQDGIRLSPAQLVPGTQNLYDQYAGAMLLPRQQLSSLVLSGKQALTDSAGLFFDGLFNRRLVQDAAGAEAVPVTVTSNNPYYVNPLGGTEPVTVLYGFGHGPGPVVTQVDLNSGQVTAGVDQEGGWLDSLEFYVSYAYERQHQTQSNLVAPNVLEAYVNDSNPGTALNLFADGSYTNPATLAAIRSSSSLTLSSRLETADFTVTRSVFRTRAGAAKLRLSEQYRRQFLNNLSVSPGDVPTSSALSRTTLSTFAQADIPIVGPDNRARGVEKLDLSLAARYEHYSDVGAVTAPQFAVGYFPSKRLLLRGTWARLAHAQDLPNLSEASNVSTLYLLPAPPAPNSQGASPYTTALIWNGNNAQLKPETAKSWTLGANIMPFEARTLSLGLTYFHTHFTNRISDPIALPRNALLTPLWRWLLLPATAAEQNEVCARSHFVGTPGACGSTAVGAIVDLRIQNVASLDLQGVDFAAQYEWDHALSIWKFKVNATNIFQYLEQQTPSTPPQELVSTVHNPINFRMRASLSWDHHGPWATAYVKFQNHYRDIDSSPPRSIASWTTVDSALGYDFHLGPASSTELTRISISAHNLLNHYPPFVNNQYGIGYDQENSSLMGRNIRVDIRQRW